jgi:hypothetical protein
MGQRHDTRVPGCSNKIDRPSSSLYDKTTSTAKTHEVDGRPGVDHEAAPAITIGDWAFPS